MRCFLSQSVHCNYLLFHSLLADAKGRLEAKTVSASKCHECRMFRVVQRSLVVLVVTLAGELRGIGEGARQPVRGSGRARTCRVCSEKVLRTMGCVMAKVMRFVLQVCHVRLVIGRASRSRASSVEREPAPDFGGVQVGVHRLRGLQLVSLPPPPTAE